MPHLLIPVKTIRVEKVCLSDIENLGLFVNILTADNKYSLLNRDNLQQHFQKELSQKLKMFFQFFGFSKFRSNFEHFQKKR